jgi:hypothetical protein
MANLLSRHFVGEEAAAATTYEEKVVEDTGMANRMDVRQP